MTAFKSFLYLILAAGLGAWYFPLVLLPKSPQVETGIFAYLAFPFWLIGGFEILWCFWDFTFKGRGTPLPLDPPKELVATGPYRYVRNPIYVGVLVHRYRLFSLVQINLDDRLCHCRFSWLPFVYHCNYSGSRDERR